MEEFATVVREYEAATNRAESMRRLVTLATANPSQFVSRAISLMLNPEGKDDVQIAAALMALAQKEQLLDRVSPSVLEGCYRLVMEQFYNNSEQQKRTKTLICSTGALLAFRTQPLQNLLKARDISQPFYVQVDKKVDGNKQYGQSWFLFMKEMASYAHTAPASMVDTQLYLCFKDIVTKASENMQLNSVVLVSLIELVEELIKFYIKKQLSQPNEVNFFMDILETLSKRKDPDSVQAIRNCYRQIFVEEGPVLNPANVDSLLGNSLMKIHNNQFVELYREIFEERWSSYSMQIKKEFKRIIIHLVQLLTANILVLCGQKSSISKEHRIKAITSFELLVVMKQHFAALAIEQYLQGIISSCHENSPEYMLLLALRCVYGKKPTDLEKEFTANAIDNACSILYRMCESATETTGEVAFKETMVVAIRSILQSENKVAIVDDKRISAADCLIHVAYHTRSITVLDEIEQTVPLLVYSHPKLEEFPFKMIMHICESVLFRKEAAKSDKERRRVLTNIVETFRHQLDEQQREQLLVRLLEISPKDVKNFCDYKGGHIAEVFRIVIGTIKVNEDLTNRLFEWCGEFSLETRVDAFLTVVANLLKWVEQLSPPQGKLLGRMVSEFKNSLDHSEGVAQLSIRLFCTNSIPQQSVHDFLVLFSKHMVSGSISVPVKLIELQALIKKMRECEELFLNHKVFEQSLINAYLTVDTLLKGKNAISNKAEFEFRDAVLMCLIIILRRGDNNESLNTQWNFADQALKNHHTSHSDIWDRDHNIWEICYLLTVFSRLPNHEHLHYLFTLCDQKLEPIRQCVEYKKECMHIPEIIGMAANAILRIHAL